MSRDDLHLYLARLVRVSVRRPDPTASKWKVPTVLWKVGVSAQPAKRMRYYPHYWPKPCNFYLKLDRLYVTEPLDEARKLEGDVLGRMPWNLPEGFPTCCDAVTELRVSRTKRPPVSFMESIEASGVKVVRLI